ncbi:YdcK family protein [Enterobacteriaceae bacterium H20N1]|uniref:YdcK family protein n=1 Tax=Dryocola boscaweniae TaxID=2925397 RepID=A0A9X2WAZ5_9ENTR|nr:YdcK family protein [Dryocola boscaweniae]MCT4703771.1 YdcK family protein [Dryocola boscaweniae]MCT4716949.1 YdcK family protein [Dryocola boscaweniae]MCT4720939.1 YdcK family protein [Dryocola boscaweniae]
MNKYELTDDSQLYDYLQDGEKQQVRLWQIRALRDFSDVKAGQTGGWVENEASLSQQGECWVYDNQCRVFGGSDVKDNAQIRGASTLCHQAHVSGNAVVENSLIGGECFVRENARVMNGSQVIAVRGLTADRDQLLQIYGNAVVSASRVVHQAQIYGDAAVRNAFIEHRAEVFGHAVLEGNEENNVWICDCARIFDNARIIAGSGEDQIPTIRYSSQVYGNAVIEGDCVLKHHVRIFDDAALVGGPVQLDNHVQIYGGARVTGNVLIENNVQVYDKAVIDGFGGELIHIRGIKTINGEQRVTRTPFYGVF